MDPATPEGKKLVENIAELMEALKDEPNRDQSFRFLMQGTLSINLKDALMAYRLEKGLDTKPLEPVQPSLPSKAHHGRRSRRAITNVARL